METLSQAESSIEMDRSKEIGDFLFWSFYFAQGKIALHHGLMYYGRRHFGPELEQMSAMEKEDILEATTRRADSWVHSGAHTNVGADVNIEDEVNEFWLLLNGKMDFRFDRSHLGLRVSNLLIGADLTHVMGRTGGRPRRHTGAGPYNNPSLSQTIHYGLLGAKTPSPAFDDAFAEAKAAIDVRLRSPQEEYDRQLLGSQYGTSQDVLRSLQAVTRAHVQSRPQDQQPLEQLGYGDLLNGLV